MSTLTRKTTRPTGPRNSRRDDFVSLDGLLTVADWEALSDTKPPYELIDGKLVQKMVTTNKHSWAVGELMMASDKWADESHWRFFSCGPGVSPDRYSGYIPDVMGFPPEVVLDPQAKINPIPTLVSEIISPETEQLDRTTKKDNYQRAGVALYLLIDPDSRTLEVFRLENGQYGNAETLTADAVWQPTELPGLRVELARLWMESKIVNCDRIFRHGLTK